MMQSARGWWPRVADEKAARTRTHYAEGGGGRPAAPKAGLNPTMDAIDGSCHEGSLNPRATAPFIPRILKLMN